MLAINCFRSLHVISLDGPGLASDRRPVATRHFRLVVGTLYILAASLNPFNFFHCLGHTHFDPPFTSCKGLRGFWQCHARFNFEYFNAEILLKDHLRMHN